MEVEHPGGREGGHDVGEGAGYPLAAAGAGVGDGIDPLGVALDDAGERAQLLVPDDHARAGVCAAGARC